MCFLVDDVFWYCPDYISDVKVDWYNLCGDREQPLQQYRQKLKSHINAVDFTINEKIRYLSQFVFKCTILRMIIIGTHKCADVLIADTLIRLKTQMWGPK